MWGYRRRRRSIGIRTSLVSASSGRFLSGERAGEREGRRRDRVEQEKGCADAFSCDRGREWDVAVGDEGTCSEYVAHAIWRVGRMLTFFSFVSRRCGRRHRGDPSDD